MLTKASTLPAALGLHPSTAFFGGRKVAYTRRAHIDVTVMNTGCSPAQHCPGAGHYLLTNHLAPLPELFYCYLEQFRQRKADDTQATDKPKNANPANQTRRLCVTFTCMCLIKIVNKQNQKNRL